ncbi:hypothetical protein [Clostridium estertheticum]|uniref:hypothetical protein n=1 Tax=Clostridium estertheticum TaxID=238834 RepID=UPI001C0E16CF|nr:hypothetical protein [Clostridium estertheticum]MBU3173296.1 hypothetical protein [Clostridium estertheticum]
MKLKYKKKLEALLHRKSKGNVMLLVGLALPVLLSILFYIVSVFIVGEQAATIKDKADFTNLSVYKDINQQELSKEGNITFEETDLNNALTTYTSYLKDNFKLDANLTIISPNSYIVGTIIINKIVIYKVKNGLTTEWDYNGSTGYFNKVWDSTSAKLTTPFPNNKLVSNTSIYSELIVPTKFPYVGTRNVKIVSYTDAVH